MIYNLNCSEIYIEEVILKAVNKALTSSKQQSKEWMSITEGAKYAGVSHNTFMKFREMGLKIFQVNGIKRVSRKEIDTFLESNSF
ncbi:helix-turn-helix domain-containing protein [Rummeliibacillus sp. NPDC094406]|uniref:helix-turn-helix domain-containing protein n=1 Tax=Rummeliibacillus sp. NPDC094406 TaxID=3364511 RepID=UPI00382EF042